MNELLQLCHGDLLRLLCIGAEQRSTQQKKKKTKNKKKKNKKQKTKKQKNKKKQKTKTKETGVRRACVKGEKTTRPCQACRKVCLQCAGCLFLQTTRGEVICNARVLCCVLSPPAFPLPSLSRSLSLSLCLTCSVRIAAQIRLRSFLGLF